MTRATRTVVAIEVPMEADKPPNLRTEPHRIERRTEPPAEPELLFDGEFDPRGVSQVRAGARGPLAVSALAVVLIVLIVGVVVVARTSGSGMRREESRRQDVGRCTERIQRTEVIERSCAGDDPPNPGY